ncbi:MAG: peptidase [Microbacterium sp. 69-10]|uniref:peptidase n=1 Tax=unclassified Microbacterium TaxID=2609290 RepID=UPI000966A90A|nr:peptidase [Microbacterium sp. 69-10]OJU42081.1 MAG: peptidase [Microbacterium sp. 69-10]
MSVEIDWMAFLSVFAAALIGAVAIVAFYALGLRMLVRAGRVPVVTPAEFTDAITVLSEKDIKRAAKQAEKAARKSPLTEGQKTLAFVAALGCFALCAAAVIGGILLIVLGGGH